MLQLAKKDFKAEAVNMLKDIKVYWLEPSAYGWDFHSEDHNREI